MKNDLDSTQYDLTVIGTGMAGMAATVFGANRGLSICQVGSTTEIGFASGLLDLLGVYPIEEGKQWDDPWAGIDALVLDRTQHPYAKISKDDIRRAFDELLTFLESAGLSYTRHLERNTQLITLVGNIKTTYCVPQTMWNGAEAFEQKPPCLIVGFNGLKGFSSGLICNALKKTWPGLRAVNITFPEKEQKGEILPEHMANTLAIPQNRERLMHMIRPHLFDAQIIGMPAVLGLHHSLEIVSDLERRIGVPLFEISTMPPAIPGLRLKEAFERGLREKRSHYFAQTRVLDVTCEKDNYFKIVVGHKKPSRTILSKGIIIATGRFIGGGLSSDRKHIHETIFDLPVHQPETRVQWHREDFLDPQGHPINQAGLEVDDHFRPLAANKEPAFQTLFAAGSILAHSDWKRMKCGSGLAIATAYAAVKAFTDHFHPKNLLSQ